MESGERPHGALKPAPPRRFGAWALAAGGILLSVVAAGCSGESPESERPDPAQMVDGGSWYMKAQWPHDGNPFETEHFVVYSDGASQQARQRLGALAEEVWAEVVDEMGIDPATMFKFPADQAKVDLYANRYNVMEGGGARAYYAGVIIWSFDHPAGRENTDIAVVRVTLKHELVHVAEALLKGRFVGDVAVGDPRRMPVWFSEGTGEALSGGTTGGSPRTVDQMDGLIAEYGRINPVAWRVDLPMSEVMSSDAYPRYYYPMAQLAVEYLLDSDGLGKSPEDLAAVMLDMGEDITFADAFESHMGIRQADYEAQFFTLMNAYLPQSEVPWEAFGLGLVALLAAFAMGGSLVWGLRRRPAGLTAPPQSGSPVWSRRASRGFFAEIGMFALVAVGLTSLALFSIGLDELPDGANRALAYAVTGCYLVVSTVILLWAIRRWGIRSGRAYLIPLLVIVATLIAITLIDQILL